MVYSDRAFPAISSASILPDARLFSTRETMISGLDLPRHGVIAEIGVALGDFSRFLIDSLDPTTFLAIDTFQMHAWPEHWGRSSVEIFGNATRSMFAREGERVVIHVGMSHSMMLALPDHSCDLIYIDAAHDYESVSRDAEIATTKAKRDGVLIFNDYVLYDPFIDAAYGVVPAVSTSFLAPGNGRLSGLPSSVTCFATSRHCCPVR